VYCSLASKARAARERVQLELARAVLASEQRAARYSRAARELELVQLKLLAR